MKQPETVFIALGSNLGDRSANLTRAIELLGTHVNNLELSSVYQTPPWGVIDQPDFLNQVVQGSTTLAPHRLLDELKRIEKTIGRQPSVRYGPRLIDLDILLFGELLINSPRLQVPHPRMLERAFVLLPLAELSPGLIIPGTHSSLTTHLSRLDSSGVELFKRTQSGMDKD